MSLKEIQKELYDPNAQSVPHPHEEDRYDPLVASHNQENPFLGEDAWKIEQGTDPRKKKIIIISAVIAFVLALIVGGIWFTSYLKKTSFYEERVTISVDGPSQIDSGQLQKYTVILKNDNRSGLKNVDIVIEHSENFVPDESENLNYVSPGSSRIYVGSISGREEKKITFSGRFFAPRDYDVYLRVTENYTPASVNGLFQMKSQFKVNIKESPISLMIAAPSEAVSGETITYDVSYENLGDRPLTNLQLKFEYPDGFEFKDAQPSAAEGNDTWNLGTLGLKEKGILKINGKIKGASDEGKLLKASIGMRGKDGQFIAYNLAQRNMKLITPMLSIEQSFDGTIDKKNPIIKPGETIGYRISYKNNGNIGLRDVIISVKIDHPLLNYQTLQLPNRGAFNDKEKTITWKASDIAKLANLGPGETGELKFSIGVLSMIPVNNEKDKNFIISSVAQIDSPDVPVHNGVNKVVTSSPLDIKVSSKVFFDQFGYYNDAVMKNSGPVPPEVGKETMYTVRWQISSVSNDLVDVRVVASLPTGVSWGGKGTDNEKISFNERTNQLIWQPEIVKAGSGILVSQPKREASFRVKITPQISQVDQEVTLVNPPTMTGKDQFTGEDIKITLKSKTTALPEDVSIGSSGYVVVSKAGPSALKQ